MKRLSWLIYGAYGYTGRQVVREAVRRGHRPVLAGRDRERLRSFATAHDLHGITLSLSDREKLAEVFAEYDLVAHLAGPYTITAEPVLQACLRAGTHYIDITGELQVFRHVYEQHKPAQQKGIALIPGCGFDVIPTDSIAAHLAERMPDATSLDIAINPETKLSAGTAKAAVEVIADGGYVRRDGKLVAQPIGHPGPNVRFHQGERGTMASPLADLESAWRTTGIPNITTYLALPPGAGIAKTLAPAATSLLRFRPLRRIIKGAADLVLKGKTDDRTGMASLWGRAQNADGQLVETWMRTPEPYSYTAQAVVNVVEAMSRRSWSMTGALTPAQAFGTDFALTIPGTERYDRFPM